MTNEEILQAADAAWLLEGALRYAARGWKIFPLAARSKVPLKGTNGVKDATSDPVAIRRFWDIAPNANIGCACGAESGFFALDVDPRNGGDETLSQLERKYEPLPATVTSRTGGGGEHRLFRHIAGIKNGTIGPGLDIKASDGYIVLPGSVHPNGRHYHFCVDGHPDHVAIAMAPPWLIALLTTTSSEKKARPPEYWRTLIRSGAQEGARNTALTRLAGMLFRCDNLDVDVAVAVVEWWNATHCHPPLAQDELERTLNSIAAAELRRRGAS
jgi:hypothetical protein